MRILYVGPNRIGDAVLSSGLLNFLCCNYPSARITVACGTSAAPLFAELPRLDRLIPMHKQPRAGHWWDLWCQVVGQRWSLVVDVRRSIIPWTVLSKRRAIAPPKSRKDEHAVISFSRTLDRAGSPLIPRLWMAEKHHAAAAELIPKNIPVIAVAPTANWQGKIWPAERFVESIRRLTEADTATDDAVLPDAKVAVLGAGNEREAAAPVLDAFPAKRIIDLVGTQDLLTIGACLKRSSLFVGNDSGLMHMAAASGIPTVGLFGPSHPERYAPWGSRTTWVTTEIPYSELVGRKGYDHRTTDTLMDSLSVDEVVRASAKLWRRMGEDGE